MKITKKFLQKLIREELDNIAEGDPAMFKDDGTINGEPSFKPSGSMATLKALLPRNDMEGGAMSRGDRVERRKEIVVTLKKIVGDDKEKAKNVMAAAMKRQRDNKPLLSDNIQAGLLKAFFNNGRASFFKPTPEQVPMQESRNISEELAWRRGVHPVARKKY